MESKKKYVMIVTAEDEQYEKGQKGLDFFMNYPWEGELVGIVYGDSFEKLYENGKYEGLFYQLYDIFSGVRISFGTLDPDSPREEIMQWEDTKESFMSHELKEMYIKELLSYAQFQLYTVDQGFVLQLFEKEVCTNDLDTDCVWEESGHDLQALFSEALSWCKQRYYVIVK